MTTQAKMRLSLFLVTCCLVSCGGDEEKKTPVAKPKEDNTKTLVKRTEKGPDPTKSAENAPEQESSQDAVRRRLVTTLQKKLAATTDSEKRADLLGEVVEKAKDLGDKSTPLWEPIVACLSDEEPFTRGLALEAVAAVGAEKSRQHLENGLKDAEAEVRQKAAEAWVRAGIKDTEPIVALVSTEIDAKAQQAMVVALEKLGTEGDVERMAGLVENLDGVAAIPALRFLTNHKEKGKAFVSLFCDCLQRRDVGLRLQAARSLLEFGVKTKPVLESLVSALADEQMPVRKAAAETLRALTSENLGFDPEAPEEARAKAIADWKEWVKNMN